MELRLSQAYPADDGDIKVVAHVLNVNYGHNRDIMEASKTLGGYAYLVHLIRENTKVMPPEKAIPKAMERCIEEGVLADYLTVNFEDTIEGLLSWWDEDEVRELWREEAREDGFAEGRNSLVEKMRELGVDPAIIERALAETQEMAPPAPDSREG